MRKYTQYSRRSLRSFAHFGLTFVLLDKRSSFLRYLEEALAETYAQIKVHGSSRLPSGLSFPVRKGYVTVSSVLKEGAIGTVVIGGVTYAVYYAASHEADPNDER